MKIEINNLQGRLQVDRQALRAMVRSCLRLATKGESSPSWGDVSVVLVDHAGIRALNRRHLGRDGTTDVLAFTFPPLPGEKTQTGEIIVNAELAGEIGRRRPGGAAVELAYYLAHACDHLCGGVDDDPPARRRMQRRERRWLRSPSLKPLVMRLLGASYRRNENLSLRRRDRRASLRPPRLRER
jgi:rRNA maturation RNase YbeY